MELRWIEIVVAWLALGNEATIESRRKIVIAIRSKCGVKYSRVRGRRK